MRDVPVSVILSWPSPNYANPQTRGQGLTIINSTLVAVLIIVVALRYYTRIRLKKWFGLDDWFIGGALLSSIALNIVVVLADKQYGWNKHIYDISYEQIQPALKLAMLAKLWFTLAATFTRTSLLCFYYRLVAHSGIMWFRKVLIVCHIFVAAVGIAFVFLTIFQCSPVSAYWTYPAVPSFAAHCMDEGVITLISGVINSIADLLVTVVPIPIIMRLQMPRSQRFGVIILLNLGFIVTIIGILRTYYIWYVFMNTFDETWWSYPLYICATVEIDMGVICACVPAIRPLFMHYFRSTSNPISKISEKLSATFHSNRSKSSSQDNTRNNDDSNTSSRSHENDRDGEELTTRLTASRGSAAAKKRATTSIDEVEELDKESSRMNDDDRISPIERGASPGWSSMNGSTRGLLSNHFESLNRPDDRRAEHMC